MSDTYATSLNSGDVNSGNLRAVSVPYSALGFMIVVVAPTLFWGLVFTGLSNLIGAPASWSTITLVSVAIATFLTLVWSVMVRGRTEA